MDYKDWQKIDCMMEELIIWCFRKNNELKMEQQQLPKTAFTQRFARQNRAMGILDANREILNTKIKIRNYYYSLVDGLESSKEA